VDWLINLGGLVTIGFIAWWFWIAKPQSRQESGVKPIEVLVDNGVYTPARIEVPAGRPILLEFLRKDQSPCAEQVIFDDLGIVAELPVGEKTRVTVIPPQPGEYEFTCQMKMYRGVLVARS
jgi:plastocyanin domain-containing protein